MNPRIFQIHVVDVGPMPEAPTDPTPQFVSEAAQGFINKINGEVEHLLTTLTRERDEALAAVEEWRKIAEERETKIGHALYEIEAHVRDYNACASARETFRKERDSARAENVRLHNRVTALCDTDRNAARLVAMIAERDRAIAERDEARKALAAQTEKTNECTRALNAYPGVAELAALRARVAELEAEKGWSLGVKKFVAADGTQYSVAEYVDLMRGRVAELESTIKARDKRVEYLSSSIHAIQSLVDSV